LQYLGGESGIGDITDMFAHVWFSLWLKYFYIYLDAVFAAWMYNWIGAHPNQKNPGWEGFWLGCANLLM
jgi:hypothetical protein